MIDRIVIVVLAFMAVVALHTVDIWFPFRVIIILLVGVIIGFFVAAVRYLLNERREVRLMAIEERCEIEESQRFRNGTLPPGEPYIPDPGDLTQRQKVTFDAEGKFKGET